MQKDPSVKFVRIKGRIVPIRSKKSDGKKKGLALVGAGIATAVGTAELAHQAVKHASAFKLRANPAFRAFARFQKSSKVGLEAFPEIAKGVKAASESAVAKRAVAAKIFKARNAILLGGGALATALLSVGVGRLQDKSRKTQFEEDRDTVVNAAISSTVAGGVAALYYKRLGIGSIGAALANAAARVKGVARPHIIPIKTKYGTFKF